MKKAIKKTFLVISIVVAVITAAAAFLSMTDAQAIDKRFIVQAIMFLISVEYVLMFMYANRVFEEETDDKPKRNNRNHERAGQSKDRTRREDDLYGIHSRYQWPDERRYFTQYRSYRAGGDRTDPNGAGDQTQGLEAKGTDGTAKSKRGSRLFVYRSADEIVVRDYFEETKRLMPKSTSPIG